MKNHLAPELIAAVVESESDFRPRLVSHKSAQGLMQIVPETARLMGCDDPFDPHANIAAGTRYLHYLVDRFGDEKIALAAYNAGEGTVERLGGGIPQYPETIDYVHRVTTPHEALPAARAEPLPGLGADAGVDHRALTRRLARRLPRAA